MKSTRPKFQPLLKRSELVAGKKYKAVTKDRRPIDGILEIMPVKQIVSYLSIGNGVLDAEFAGESVDFAEEGKPVIRRKGFVFLDGEGKEYTEGAVRYIEIEE